MIYILVILPKIFVNNPFFFFLVKMDERMLENGDWFVF